MDTSNLRHRMYSLSGRRDEITRALMRIGGAIHDTEQNADWLDQAQSETRLAAADSLRDALIAELKRIDKALVRIAKHEYGLCLGCRQTLAAERLDAAPEAEFCAACQKTREALENV